MRIPGLAAIPERRGRPERGSARGAYPTRGTTMRRPTPEMGKFHRNIGIGCSLELIRSRRAASNFLNSTLLTKRL